jgi:cellulose synthase/poly-beta-1,6-N-acetylglucosamine synthase-like glycosyltransferase
MTAVVQPHNINDVTTDRERGRALTVSVVIPTYNRSAILARTLESLASQEPDSPRFDVHVADDGSEENIASIVEAAVGLDTASEPAKPATWGLQRPKVTSSSSSTPTAWWAETS